MWSLTWDDCLCVGIHEIDTQHRQGTKQINQLADLVKSNDDIDNFLFLHKDFTGFAKQHFACEEGYLQRYRSQNITEHRQLHQHFIDKLNQQYNRITNTPTMAMAAEIVDEMSVNWTNHIIDSDVELIRSSTKTNTSTGKMSALRRIKTQISRHFEQLNIRTQTLAAIALPLLIMMAFAITILNGERQKADVMMQLSEWVDTTLRTSSLIHELQKERGLSAAYISSENNQFTDVLSKQRQSTDQQLILFRNALIQTGQTHEKRQMDFQLNLEKLRHNVDKLTHKAIASSVLYADIIEHLLDRISVPAGILKNRKIANYTRVLLEKNRYAEASGMERAVGAAGFTRGHFDQENQQKLYKYIVRQEMHGNNLNRLMNKVQKSHWQATMKKPYTIKIEHMRKLAASNQLSESQHQSLISDWWQANTQKIDNIHLSTRQLSSELNTLTHQLEEKITLQLTLISLTLTASILLTGLILLAVSSSIARPIERVTASLRALACGDRSQILPDACSHNEIGDISRAYETLRRSMIRLTILEQEHGNSTQMVRQQMVKIEEHVRVSDELRNMAVTDPLTEGLNRRGFFESAEKCIRQRQKNDGTLSLLMIDIDHFKTINDNYGHGTGDEILKHFTKVCRLVLRNQDIMGRIGGEEFAVLLSGGNIDSAQRTADRLCQQIAKSNYNHGTLSIQYTASIGIADCNSADVDINNLLQRADQALYKAKAAGRNRTVAECSI